MNPLTPPQSAYDQIEARVKRFKALSKRERDAYNEDNTRKDFILPMFHALGWDIQDAREVTAEEKVSRGFVDFAFRIGGIPRLMLETKRIGEDLNKPEWAQQAIDYAYHKDVTWAVLSDFEGLKIFNAEAREANPFHAQFKEFSVDEYLPRLDELWWLSRPAMVDGVLDREAEKVFKKTPRLRITTSLFDNLVEWRRELRKNLTAYNRGKLWTPQQIDDAAQRILDRLIFIRTAEDRGMEEHRLIALVRELEDRKQLNELIPALKRRFRQLDEVYNSELFAPHFSEDLDLGETHTLVNIINGLDRAPGSFVRFNFAFIDADVLGRVYEQYLGSVLAKQSDLVEAKHKKRKSQGIYYTPTFVVKYIVQQTLGRYLEENGYNPARPVRVLDPACGSGSFLIEAFDVLDQHIARTAPTPSLPRSQSFDYRSGRRTGEGEGFDMHDHARHRQILSTNIYGVDKDAQAVEVAQLNLLLKALNHREKLPKLENIRCGDSLISGTPKELEEFFGASAKEKNAFNWEREFSQIFNREGAKDAKETQGFDVIVGNPPYVRIQTLPKDDVDFFNEHYAAATGNYDIYILFVERALQLLKPGGVFGMILPKKFMQTAYGEGLRKLLADQKAVWKIVDFGDAQVFADATTYTCLLFLQKQVNANIAYVPAGDWLKEQAGAPKELPTTLTEYSVKAESMTNAEWNFVVGDSAALFEKLKAMPLKLGDVADIFVGLQTSADDVFIMDFVDETSKALRLKSKTLGSSLAFEKGLLFPIVSGTDVTRYGKLPERQYILFPYKVDDESVELIEWKTLSGKYPKTAEYLSKNKKQLEAREKGKAKGSRWYGYIYLKNMARQAVEKLCVPRLVDKLYAAYDMDGKHFLDNVDVGGITLKTEHQEQGLFYLLALLNSKLLRWFFPFVSVPFRGGWLSANRQFLSQLPIHCIAFDNAAEKLQHDEIVAHVAEMLDLQKEYAEASREKLPRADSLARKIAEVDAMIDAAVYRLYDLSEEEISVVEGAGQ